MPPRISLRYLVAFGALVVLVTELHEQAHIGVGRLVCGCYGPRDFSVWSTCEGCASPSLGFLATLAGPVFSYLLAGLGIWLLRGESVSRRHLGWALVFSILPFARLFTALTGRGDETMVLRLVLADQLSPFTIAAGGAALVSALCLPIFVIAYRALDGRRRSLALGAFAIGPMLFSALWNHRMMNGILASGVLDEVSILGTPSLILLHTTAAAVVLVLFGRSLACDPGTGAQAIGELAFQAPAAGDEPVRIAARRP